MAIFVINEWLWEHSSGSNGPKAQREAFNVIINLAASIHQIVVIEGSAFDRKAWRLCKYTNPMIVQHIAGLYVKDVRSASDRCRILQTGAVVAIPSELAEAINPDDHYLVQALLSVPNSILVTTDGTLRETVSAAGLNSLSREEFLGTYF